jgi:putative NIF3 family GTP cyclohydrolase 1 type 2
MNMNECDRFLRNLLGPAVDIANEYGFTHVVDRKIKRIGYATNLTPETVEGAAKKEVDLLLTHHDAWEFIYGMREVCASLLEEHHISHAYAHLPLDTAEFGTSATLGKEIGAVPVGQFAKVSGFPCGCVCEYGTPISIEVIEKRLNEVCGELCQTWINQNKPITRVGIVAGGGMSTEDVKESLIADCELYITGERSLYLVEYCRFVGLNLMVGSHTFTELPGVRSLANEIKAMKPEIEVVRIEEGHYEILPNKPK